MQQPNLGGRPEIGRKVEFRLQPELIKRVDEMANREGVTRAEMLRRLVTEALARA